MASITLSNIEKWYDSNQVVKTLNLEIKDGEFIVLVGPSGCGKSTTLRMIAGLEAITNGDLLVDGKKINDLPPGKRDLAMVFQSYALYPHMNVFDNISFGLKVQKIKKDEIKKRVSEVASMLGLSDLLHRKPKQLSGGQRQRVAMGRAIVRRPKAYLFDEPLSNLDAKLRGEVRAEIARLHRQLGTTTVYVTHDQAEAMTLADRVVVLHEGIAQQIGSPMEVYSTPANKFVAGFLGTPAMNLFEGKTENGKFIIDGTKHPIPISKIPTNTTCIGIRPNNINFIKADNLNEIPKVNENEIVVGLADIDVIENLGTERFVLGNINKKKLTGKLDESVPGSYLSNLKAEDKVFVAAYANKFHFFAKDGARINV
ncbi:MAG: sn-glycerol-3-phosphate ABC transporter ATP-binding protein UgpC [Pseudomonadota bacterium]